MNPKLWVFSMDHCGTVDSPGTAGEGSGDELKRPQHARVTAILGLRTYIPKLPVFITGSGLGLLRLAAVF